MLEVLRSGRLSLGPLLAEFERAFAARVGAPHASAVSSGTAGLHLALRAVGVCDGDEVITSPFSFVASANVAVYERARPVFADIDPVTFNLDRRCRGGGHRLARRRCFRCTSLAIPPISPPSSGSACRSSRTPARRSVRSTPTGCRSAAAATRPCSAFYANKQLDDRRGRDGHDRGPRAQGADRLRAKPGSRAEHGLARPRPPRLQLPALRCRVRARSRTARAARPDARRPSAGSRRRIARRWPRSRASSCRVRSVGRVRRGWFVFVVQLPRGVDRDGVVRALCGARDPEQAVLPGGPPDDVLPRAVRSSGRRVSRCARTSRRARSRCRSSRR